MARRSEAREDVQTRGGDDTGLGHDAFSSRGISPAPSLRSVQHTRSTPVHHQTNTTSMLAPPHSNVGHFAFAPATQQTTVVTTTTTTVNLAPFLLQPPQGLRTRDPKQYPLASSSTPQSMRNLHFELGGSLATFSEADDTNEYLARYKNQQQRLRESHGRVRDDVEEKQLDYTRQTPLRQGGHQFARPENHWSLLSRDAPAPSLATAAEIARAQRRQSKGKSQLSHQQDVSDVEDEVSALQQARGHGGESPVTPDTEGDAATKLQPAAVIQGPSNALPRGARATSESQRSHSRRSTRNTEQNANLLPAQAAPPPQVLESEMEPNLPAPIARAPHPVLPPLLNTTSNQDASLPSPSLSPVTAAANLAQRHFLLNRRQLDSDDAGTLYPTSANGIAAKMSNSLLDARHGSSLPPSGLGIDQYDRDQIDQQQRSLMDVPEMISMFDALPTGLQSYVMFQLLKRSARPTLKEVAAVVNQALKLDPFDALPQEINLKIIKFLDARTMARAAQVSKKWRHLIDTDERAWRDLFIMEEFVLADGELERAVRHGWGWQFPGQDGYERDASQDARRSSRSSARGESDGQSSRANGSDEETLSSSRYGRKRKAAGVAGSSKRQKRKVSTPHDEDLRYLRGEIQDGNGPIAYASAAALVVPNPKIGLPSLQSLHLFKSIFARHWMVRNAWMDGSCQPHHLAFRAHHRHVVTCLLFNSDRIITGSDDTSINVFDTKTGVLHKRLEGHEGGVWALSAIGNTLVSGSTDRSVRIWDIENGRCMQTFQGHTSTVRCLVILTPEVVGEDADGQPIVHPTEPVIITGSRDSSLRVWKLPGASDSPLHQAGPPENESDNPYALRTLNGHHNSVRALAAHGDTLVSGSYDCTVRVWRISTGEMVHRLTGHAQKVYSVVLDHQRGRCISGSMDTLVKVWSLESGTCLFNLEGHTSLVGLLELSENTLVSAAADSTLRVWDPDNGACKNILSAHTGAITCFQHDSSKVVSGSDRTLKMWNMESGECVRDLLTDLSGVWQVRFDERRCVAAVQRNNLTYIEVLDFGASRDGIPEANRGRRIVVDHRGREVQDDESRLTLLEAGPELVQAGGALAAEPEQADATGQQAVVQP